MDTKRVMEKFGIYFDEIGLNKTYGRLFGFFMTTNEPVSMNQLVEKLQISKSTASVEIRRLLSMGAIEKVLLTDKRADFYQLKKNIWALNLQQKIRDIKKLQAIIEEIPNDKLENLGNLKEMATYCVFIESELEAIVTKYLEFCKAKKQTISLDSGSYIDGGKRNKKYVVEWTKHAALSETFANEMASLADLGIDSFSQVEIEFLASYPQAMKEDESLKAFTGLKNQALKEAMTSRLHKIFLLHPKDLNDDLRSFMKDVYYYLVTIKEENSDEIKGFITFMGGGSIPRDEYKITVLAVKKTARRKGVAGLLINSLKKIGVPCKKLYASTRPSNTTALNAFKKWGFMEDIKSKKNASSFFVNDHWIHLSQGVE